ncbi:hypothetical protein LXA43DRAFT_244513 [Ganoderma leucocontextum]|nr:hypothetical protein LXA43DRAFT_244513 [Ganoderma leucocontextum]
MDGVASGVAASARAREERCTQAFRLPRSVTRTSHSGHSRPPSYSSTHMFIVRTLAQIHLHCQLALSSLRTQQGPPRSPSRPNPLWARNNTRLSRVSQPRTQHRDGRPGGPRGTEAAQRAKNNQHARRASFRSSFHHGQKPCQTRDRLGLLPPRGSVGPRICTEGARSWSSQSGVCLASRASSAGFLKLGSTEQDRGRRTDI